MFIDANLVFDQGAYSASAGMIGINQFANGATNASTNVIDLLNARDLGAAPDANPASLTAEVLITTAFTGGTSVNVQFQGSTDNVTYTTYSETGAIPVASLTVGAVFTLRMPMVNPDGGPMPRYLRLAYVNVGNNTAGAVIAWLGTVSGIRYYKPGITVAN